MSQFRLIFARNSGRRFGVLEGAALLAEVINCAFILCDLDRRSHRNAFAFPVRNKVSVPLSLRVQRDLLLFLDELKVVQSEGLLRIKIASCSPNRFELSFVWLLSVGGLPETPED